MASCLLAVSAQVFPDGTSIGAYLAQAQGAEVRPFGTALDTRTVSAGAVTFTGLTEDESYYAYGQVNSVWRRIAFKLNAVPDEPVYTDFAQLAGDNELTGENDFTGGTVEVAAPAAAANPVRTDDVRLATPINVKTHGAAGDGIADDTAEFVAARTAAGVGGTIYVPPGTYILDEFLMNVAGQTLDLASGAIIKLKGSSAGGDAIQLMAAHITVRGGTFDGNRTNQSVSGGALISIRAAHARVEDVYFHDAYSFGVAGAPLVAATPLDDIEVSGCAFVDCVSLGVFLNLTGATVSSSGLRIISCYSDNVALGDVGVGGGFAIRGAAAYPVTGAVVADCVAKGSVEWVIETGGINLTYCRGGAITNCHTEGFWEGIATTPSTDIAISGCTVTGADQYAIELAEATHVTVSGCIINGDGVSTIGIALNRDCTDIVIDGCHVHGLLLSDFGKCIDIQQSGGDPQERVTITGCELSGRRGVDVNGDLHDCSIKDNLIAADTAFATSRYGILWIPSTGGSQRWSIRGNQVLDCNTTWLIITGTGTMQDIRVAGNDVFDSVAASLTGTYDASNQIVEEKAVGTVASAATVTLPWTEIVTVSGTADVTSITASWAGRRVTLVFSGNKATTGVVDGSNLKLAGDFAYSTEDTLTLICDGTDWREIARSTN